MANDFPDLYEVPEVPTVRVKKTWGHLHTHTSTAVPLTSFLLTERVLCSTAMARTILGPASRVMFGSCGSPAGTITITYSHIVTSLDTMREEEAFHYANLLGLCRKICHILTYPI